MSLLNKAATEILSKTSQKRSLLSKTAATVQSSMKKIAFVDRDAEWQRVHSYIADALKDMHVLYAKLARLQGDFSGTELEELDAISESVLDLGEKMSKFSREFSQGNLRMMDSSPFQGDPNGGGGGQPPPPAPAPPPAPEGAPIPEEGPAPEEASGEAEEPESEEKVPVIVEESEGPGPEEWADEEAPEEEEGKKGKKKE